MSDAAGIIISIGIMCCFIVYMLGCIDRILHKIHRELENISRKP